MNNIRARDVFRILTFIGIFVGLILLAYLTRRELSWIVTAFFLAVCLNPAVEKIASRLPRQNRGLAAGLVFLIVILAVVVMAILLVPPLVRQTQSLIDNLPRYIDEIGRSDNFIGRTVRQYDLIDRVKQDQSQLIGQLSSATGSALDVAKSIFSSIAATVTVIGLTFFMLLEGPAWLQAFVNVQPSGQRQHTKRVAGQMYRAVTGYVTGNLLTSLVAAVTTSIVLAILGVPYAIPLGIVVGVFDLIPLVGATLGALVVTLISLFTSTTAAIIMLVYFLAYQQVENHVMQPIVYSRTVKISPLLVLISVLIGAALAGILGALLAIPLAASLQILIKDYLQRRNSAVHLPEI